MATKDRGADHGRLSQKTYPQMRVEAIFDDAVSNLVDEQIDLGIRVGWLTDSSNQARRLGTICSRSS